MRDWKTPNHRGNCIKLRIKLNPAQPWRRLRESVSNLPVEEAFDCGTERKKKTNFGTRFQWSENFSHPRKFWSYNSNSFACFIFSALFYYSIICYRLINRIELMILKCRKFGNDFPSVYFTLNYFIPFTGYTKLLQETVSWLPIKKISLLAFYQFQLEDLPSEVFLTCTRLISVVPFSFLCLKKNCECFAKGNWVNLAEEDLSPNKNETGKWVRQTRLGKATKRSKLMIISRILFCLISAFKHFVRSILWQEKKYVNIIRYLEGLNNLSSWKKG